MRQLFEDLFQRILVPVRQAALMAGVMLEGEMPPESVNELLEREEEEDQDRCVGGRIIEGQCGSELSEMESSTLTTGLAGSVGPISHNTQTDPLCPLSDLWSHQ